MKDTIKGWWAMVMIALFNRWPKKPEKPDTRALIQSVKLGPRPAMVNWIFFGHEVKLIAVLFMN